MAKGDKESTPKDDPDRKCVYRGCNQRKGLKKSQAGNWYCVAHHPDSKKKHKAAASRGGKASVRVQREERDAELLTLQIEPNKASILKALVLQGNYLAKDIGPKELKRHRMILEIMDRIHDYATEEGDDAQKQQKVADIMASELPPEIKLSKLTDVVGPAKACEMIKVTVTRNAYEDKVLDGEKLLKEAGADGAATISLPQNFEVETTEDTADLPPVELGTVQTEPGAPVTAPSGAALPATAPAEPAPPPSESLDQKERRAVQQAEELTGLYRAKCPLSPTPIDTIRRSFFQGLMDGAPFRELQARCMFPKSDTDQPAMMVKDVIAAEAKRKAAIAGT